jgi:hypothetical protein
VGRFQDLRFVVGMWFDGYTLMESIGDCPGVCDYDSGLLLGILLDHEYFVGGLRG